MCFCFQISWAPPSWIIVTRNDCSFVIRQKHFVHLVGSVTKNSSITSFDPFSDYDVIPPMTSYTPSSRWDHFIFRLWCHHFWWPQPLGVLWRHWIPVPLCPLRITHFLPFYHMLLRIIGEIQMSRDQFRCVFIAFLYVTKVFSESVALASPKLCSRWHWLGYRWNDQWTWWIVRVPILSQRCEWREMFCIVRVRQVRIFHKLLEICKNFSPNSSKSCWKGAQKNSKLLSVTKVAQKLLKSCLFGLMQKMQILHQK